MRMVWKENEKSQREAGWRCKGKKKPAAPYSRTGGSRTTLGEEALDFSVRNGNWYDCLSMATGKKPLSWKAKGNRNALRCDGLTFSEVNNKLSRTPD